MKEYMHESYEDTVIDRDEATEYLSPAMDELAADANLQAEEGWEILSIVPALHSLDVIYVREAVESDET